MGTSTSEVLRILDYDTLYDNRISICLLRYCTKTEYVLNPLWNLTCLMIHKHTHKNLVISFYIEKFSRRSFYFKVVDKK